jgi:hypothetical protein
MKKYGRQPNSRGTARIHTHEQRFGRGPIYRAITWYFSADTVPDGSGAKTRTLGNFITHIDEILKLSAQSTFV